MRDQLDILKREFECNRFPTPERKRELSGLVGLDYKVVTNWFQNKRKIEYKFNKLKIHYMEMQNALNQKPQD